MLEERSREAALWDPALPGEEVTWYAEYAARHGKVSFKWVSPANNPEVRGMGVFGDDKVIGPLEDGSVCIWDIKQSQTVGNSSPGTLTGCKQDLGSLGECVSVDSARRRAYLAAGCELNEIDLDTLGVVSTKTYPGTIYAITQETDYDVPVTVATTQALHIYDPRSIRDAESASASLLEPGPLAVLHPGVQENTILVAGRFPSILSYDRRFLRLQSAVHSGGGLCGLATVPSRYTRSDKAEQKVVACGEYKGRGSLELYDLGHEGLTTKYRNRQSAARSKLLSVASHGARIIYADADGIVKWVERDARTEVRRWNINDCLGSSRAQRDQDQDQGGLFASSSGSSEVVRKVTPTGGTLTDDTVLVWTGERIGCLHLGVQDENVNNEEEEEDELTQKEREYATTMRKALERQADEVRRMGGFGL